MLSYLNTANIQRSTADIEYHPLFPCVHEDTRLIFLGSFPPPMRKWAKDFFFFYPNFINDHWRLMGMCFFNDKNRLLDLKKKSYNFCEIIQLVETHGLGYYDTSEAVKRLKDNASDKFLEVVIKTDIDALIKRAPQCKMIVVTGEKAALTLCSEYGISDPPKIGNSIVMSQLRNAAGEPIHLYRLPSSSRAYPMALDMKAQYYKQMLITAGVL